MSVLSRKSADNSGAKTSRSKSQGESPLGRIVFVSGSQAKCAVHKDSAASNVYKSIKIGSLVKIHSDDTHIIGIVSLLHVMLSQKDEEQEIHIAEIEMVGELRGASHGDQIEFFRGVGSPPAINNCVYAITQDELARVFATEGEAITAIGALSQDPSIKVFARTNELLSKHFAIVGSTGSGKSCTVALLLQSILKEHPQAHTLLLDLHDEYSASFGKAANCIAPDTLFLPYWLFNFEEICEVMTSEGSNTRHEEIDILNSLIVRAKMMYQAGGKPMKMGVKRLINDASVSVDMPMPYLISDLLKLIDAQVGRLENKNNLEPYKQLKRRIEILTSDRRYSFMFGTGGAEDCMADVIGGIFRIPVNGKPISIIDMSAIPSEIINVVVSVLARMAYDLAVWSDRKIPVLLICEEAHRYVPSDHSLGFAPTRRAIGRIAKEGRKYGVSLAIISQRPSELDATILSQCSTMFAMRLTNERDQQFAAAAVSDSAGNLLSFLPAMGTGEAMVFGESVNLPMRVKLDTLNEKMRPHSHSASFCEIWSSEDEPWGSLDDIVKYWRRQSRSNDVEQQSLPGISGLRALRASRLSTATPASNANAPEDELHPAADAPAQMAASQPGSTSKASG